MKRALRMQEVHVLECKGVEIAGAILRSSWTRCAICCAKIGDNGCRPIGTIDDNAWEARAWNFVSKLELGTSNLSCCAWRDNNPQPVCKQMRIVFPTLLTTYLRKRVEGRKFGRLSEVCSMGKKNTAYRLMARRNKARQQ